jgi:hypothetical protein
MDKGGTLYRSHLFTLRLWAEEMGADQTEWRGEVRHVTSGETRYFRDWATLVTLLMAMLPGAEDRQPQE